MVTKSGDTMKSTIPPGTPLIINSVKELVPPGPTINGTPALAGTKDVSGGQKPPASLRRLDYIRQQFLYARKGTDGGGSAGEKSFVVEGKQCRSKSQPTRILNGHPDAAGSDRGGDLMMRKAIRRSEEDGSGTHRIAGRQRDVKSSYPMSVALPMLSVGGSGPGFSHRLKSRSLPGDRNSDGGDPLDSSHLLGHESEYLSESETAFEMGSMTTTTPTVIIGGKAGVSSSLSSVSPRKVSKKVNNFFPKPVTSLSQDDFLDICVDTQKSAAGKGSNNNSSMSNGPTKVGIVATPFGSEGKPGSMIPPPGELEMTRSKTITLSLNSENAVRNGGGSGGGGRRSNSFRSRMEGSPFGRVATNGGPKPYHDTAAAQASQANFHKRQMGNKYVEAIEIKVAVEEGGLGDPLRVGAPVEPKPVPKKVVAKYSDIAIQKDLNDFFHVKPAFT